MHIQHNNLKTYRKQSRLTQYDIAFILNCGDLAQVSRYEQGQRKPNIDTLLIYHLLFDIPIEKLFERQRHQLVANVQERILLRIQELKDFEPKRKILRRIEFLQAIHIRLTALIV